MTLQMITDFFALNGYGAYVWPAFGVTVLALGWMAVDTLHRLRANERLLNELQKDDPR
jgi:heme exporter protein CcmD